MSLFKTNYELKLWLSYLPLKHDFYEAKIQHKFLVNNILPALNYDDQTRNITKLRG